MGIREDLENNLNRKPKTFAAWKLTADPEDVTALEEAFRNPEHSANSLVALCKAHGIPLSKETVMGYR